MVEQILEAGHEVGHHSYSHRSPVDLTEAEERADFERALAALDRLGVRPEGHRAAMWEASWQTAGLVAEYGLRYDSSLMDADRPYRLQAGERTIAELPAHWSLDDWEQYAFLPRPNVGSVIESPLKVLEMWRAELDAMRRHGCLFMLTCHPFLSGRPSRVEALRALIEHALDAGDVEFRLRLDGRRASARRRGPARARTRACQRRRRALSRLGEGSRRAAVRLHDLPDERSAAVAGEEGDDPGDLLRAADAPDRALGRVRRRISSGDTPASAASTSSWGVSMIPGAIALTLIPSGPSSRPSALVNEISPALDAAYAVAFAHPTTPNSDAMITIRPPPPRRIAGSTVRTRKNVPDRLTSMFFHQSPGSCSTNGAMLMYAWFATSTSMPPSSRSASATIRSTASGSDTSAIAATPPVSSTTASTPGERARSFTATRALGSETQRDSAPEALAGAADERALALEALTHQITAPAFGESVCPAK